MNLKRIGIRSRVEQPYRWSQRWHDDPPIGTIVLGHEQVIYLGNGDRRPLSAIQLAGRARAVPTT